MAALPRRSVIGVELHWIAWARRHAVTRCQMMQAWHTKRKAPDSCPKSRHGGLVRWRWGRLVVSTVDGVVETLMICWGGTHSLCSDQMCSHISVGFPMRSRGWRICSSFVMDTSAQSIEAGNDCSVMDPTHRDGSPQPLSHKRFIAMQRASEATRHNIG